MARPRFKPSSGVIGSTPARPRTPSVPNSSRFVIRLRSVAEVLELKLELELLGPAQQRDGRLQVVALLTADSDAALVNGRLHLDLRIFQDLNDLLRLLGLDAFLDLDAELGGAFRALGRLTDFEVLQAHFAADELLLQHRERRLDAIIGRGCEQDLLVLELDTRVRALEVEALRDLARRLIDGVLDLGPFDLRDDVERRHLVTFVSGRAVFGVDLVDLASLPNRSQPALASPESSFEDR